MNTISKVFQDGFFIYEDRRQLADVALLSLRTALRAYFSTYHVFKGRLWLLNQNLSGLSTIDRQKLIDHYHNPEYCEAYYEAVIHFHHFIELTVKELLRQEHPLLASDASRHPTVLRKLLKRKSVDASELEKLKSPEFSDALNRLTELINNKQINGYKRLSFIVADKPWLGELNTLRNRLMHRGTFVLRYQALDQVIGKFVFPFIIQALKLPIYSQAKFRWQHRELNCKVNPMTRIAKEALSSKPNMQRIALLKELGRAAFANPLQLPPIRKQKRGIPMKDTAEEAAENLANSQVGTSGVANVRVCPVCGVKSLVVYGDIRSDGYFDEAQGREIISREEFYTHSVSCLCCSFELSSELDCNAFMSLPIKCYWRVEELIPKEE